MTIIDKIKQALGLTKPKVAMVEDSEIGREKVNPNNPDSLIGAYKSWVYVASQRNAISVASTPLRLYVAKSSKTKLQTPTKKVSKRQLSFLTGEDKLIAVNPQIRQKIAGAIEIEEIVDHPFLDLMKSVNSDTEQFGLFELTELYQELCGDCYWYLVQGALGIPDQIYVMFPQEMKIIPGKDEFIAGYILERGTQKVPFLEEEIVHFKFTNPQDAYYGFSPLMAIVAAYNLNDNMSKYENSLFRNMAKPDGVLETANSLSDANYRKVIRDWNKKYGGVANVGKTALLDNGLQYKAISLPPKDLAILAAKKVSKEEILNAYGQTLGMYSENANRANSEMASYVYMRDTVRPRHIRLEQKLNAKLVARYDAKLFSAFDNCVPEDKEAIVKENETYVKNGIISRNEARKRADFDERPDCDEILIPAGLTPIGQAGEATEGKPKDEPKDKPNDKPKDDKEDEKDEKIISRIADKVKRILYDYSE